MSDHPTKERILDAAEELMLEKSFHSVGLNEILKAVNIPKGSFYHHFASKEAFGVELIKHYADQAYQEHSSLLLDQKNQPDARQRLLTYLQTGLDKFQENGCKCPCLIMKLASEVGSSSPDMREQISEAYQRRIELFTKVIQEAIDQKNTTPAQPAQATAEIFSSLWLGAVKQALAHQHPHLIHTTIEFIKTQLIPPAA